jgi:16S rRNA (guanine527-N7)-methyltransferase
MSAAHLLEDGLVALDLALSAATRTRLLDYIALLVKWNRTYNLTAIRDECDMVTQHLLDSLSVLPQLKKILACGSALTVKPRRLADVGSGAGLPGIPLAIACAETSPELVVTLIETVEKKSAFQRQVKIELGLDNVLVASSRVEDLPGGVFDAVISRAFANLEDFVRLAGHLPAPGGVLCAMKGHVIPAEMERLPLPWRIRQCLPLQVPGLDARRHLIVLENV